MPKLRLSQMDEKKRNLIVLAEQKLIDINYGKAPKDRLTKVELARQIGCKCGTMTQIFKDPGSVRWEWIVKMMDILRFTDDGKTMVV